MSGMEETGGGAGASSFGTAGAFGAAILGIGGGGGIFGTGGGATGILGSEGAADFPAPAFVGEDCAPAASASASFEREMICVYGLGPLGITTEAAAGSCPFGCMNAPVAPSPGREVCRWGAGFSAATLGSGGIVGTG